MIIFDRTLPDAGEGMCCLGAAVYGPGRCTCWKPRYMPPEQHVPRRDVAVTTRAQMCSDCAFRGDSPEHMGDERFENSGEGDLEALLDGSGVFFCHEGMRREVELVHVGGSRIDCGPGSYDPPIIEGVAFRADGRPAEICAGFARRKERR